LALCMQFYHGQLIALACELWPKLYLHGIHQENGRCVFPRLSRLRGDVKTPKTWRHDVSREACTFLLGDVGHLLKMSAVFAETFTHLLETQIHLFGSSFSVFIITSGSGKLGIFERYIAHTTCYLLSTGFMYKVGVVSSPNDKRGTHHLSKYVRTYHMYACYLFKIAFCTYLNSKCSWYRPLPSTSTLHLASTWTRASCLVDWIPGVSIVREVLAQELTKR